MGRKVQVLQREDTIVVFQKADEVLEDRWYRGMALLLDPKFDPEPETDPVCVSDQPVSENDILSARLEMACGMGR